MRFRKRRPPPPKHENERGQASLMIGIMIMTFISFFTFVINTGTLINAKINLQNAADLAAYAGAATQARLLNQMSYLNYEMRESFKKFLFRYYVLGNYSQDPFPRVAGSGGGSGGANYIWSPDGNKIYGVPAVCIIFQPADNNCHIPTLGHIDQVQPNVLDQIQSTLSSQLADLEAIRQTNCGAMGNMDSLILQLWLYNTDPTVAAIQSAVDPNLQKYLSVAKTLTLGLGLVPEEILLDARIKALGAYLNAAPVKGLTFAKEQVLQNQGTDPAAAERTIQAFLSAYYTLGSHNFDGASITLDEVQPAQIFSSTTAKKDFDTYAVDYQLTQGAATASNQAATLGKDCLGVLSPISVRGLPVAEVKDPKTLTYYAVKLTATVHPMFNIFGDTSLVAYAAARPFGSRMGPDQAAIDAMFTVTRAVPQSLLPLGENATNLIGQIPSLDIAPGPTTWESPDALGSFFAQMGLTGRNPVTIESVKLGIAGSRVPTPSELAVYNVPYDANDTINVIFDSNKVAAFWAPIGDASKDIATRTDQVKTDIAALTGNPQLKGSIAPVANPALSPAFIAGLATYLTQLQSGNGENHDGLNVVRISDPVFGGGVGGAPIDVPGVSVSDPTLIKTSWNHSNDKTMWPLGRVGYSVKFVSFESLRKPASGNADGQTTSTNSLPDDPDTFFIKF